MAGRTQNIIAIPAACRKKNPTSTRYLLSIEGLLHSQATRPPPALFLPNAPTGCSFHYPQRDVADMLTEEAEVACAEEDAVVDVGKRRGQLRIPGLDHGI